MGSGKNNPPIGQNVRHTTDPGRGSATAENEKQSKYYIGLLQLYHYTEHFKCYDILELLIDVHLFGGNISNLSQASLEGKLNGWVTKNTDLKIRFINKVVRKTLNRPNSNEATSMQAYLLLKEQCSGNCDSDSFDIFAQHLKASRINEVFMSIQESTSNFGVQCDRLKDYLMLIETLKRDIGNRKLWTFGKICDLIIPKLAAQCIDNDDKAYLLLKSAKYIDDPSGGQVILSLKKLAARKVEYQVFFNNEVREMMGPGSLIGCNWCSNRIRLGERI